MEYTSTEVFNARNIYTYLLLEQKYFIQVGSVKNLCMALLKYLNLVAKLPDQKGSLSTVIPLQAIAQANHRCSKQ